MDVSVNVGAGEDDDERSRGMQIMKAPNRVVAAPGMERDQQIAALVVIDLCHAHAMPEFSQNTGPAQGGDFVAVVDLERRGCDELDVHFFRIRIYISPRRKVRRRRFYLIALCSLRSLWLI